MTLPDLAWQIIYGRLAWALVLAAVLLACLPALTRRASAVVLFIMLALTLLPGGAAPPYWLTLEYHYPRGLLAGFSLVSLHARWHGKRPRFMLAPAMAMPMAAAGVLLYLDTFGVLAIGLYHGGFGGASVPLLACLATAACAWAIASGRPAAMATAVLAGLLLYTLLRLPTGNLWDALIDPLAWGWALVSALFAGLRYARALRTGLPGAVPVLEPVPVAAAGIEQFHTARE
jgi:hypothetical protein